MPAPESSRGQQHCDPRYGDRHRLHYALSMLFNVLLIQSAPKIHRRLKRGEEGQRGSGPLSSRGLAPHFCISYCDTNSVTGKFRSQILILTLVILCKYLHCVSVWL